MSSIQDIFTKNLNYYMDLSGVTQKNLIDDLGVDKSSISEWCAGKQKPRLDKLQLLADYFKISVAQLLDNREGNKDIGKAINSFVEHLNKNTFTLDGSMLSEEDSNFLVATVQMGLDVVRKKNVNSTNNKK